MSQFNNAHSAHKAINQITKGKHTFGVGDNYPEPYAVIAMDAWNEGCGYRVWRCENGCTVELVSELRY